MQKTQFAAIEKLYDIENTGPAVAVSSPGKLMLNGEHAVVYGKLCAVTAVERRMLVAAQRTEKDYVQINSPDMSKEPYQFPKSHLNEAHSDKFSYAVSAIRNFFKRYKDNKDITKTGLRLYIESQFGDAVSMGTSASVTTGVVGALRELYRDLMERSMGMREVFDLSFAAHNEAQEKEGSGFDIAASTYGGTLKYKKEGELIQPLQGVKPLTLVYVPIPKIRKKTLDMIKQVREDLKKNPEFYQRQWDKIEQVTLEAVDALKSDNHEKIGELMYHNHNLLDAIGVSSPEANRLVLHAIQAGAYGAKMTGGYGDNIIALAPKEKINKVIAKIHEEGFNAFTLETHAEGVRQETH